MTFGKLIGIATVSLSGLFANDSTLAQTDSIIDVRDGKTYKTIKIGSQWWLAQNLAYAPKITQALTRDPQVMLTKTDGYFCYMDSGRMCEQYGVLYSWETAMEACPSGWHLPSEKEYETLRSNAGRDKREWYAALIKGGATGLDALLGGAVFHPCNKPEFEQVNRYGFYWTSSTKAGATNSFRMVSFMKSLKRVDISTHQGDGVHGYGFLPNDWICSPGLSVRCVKDEK